MNAPVASVFQASALFPGIVTARFAATCEFYREHLEFRPLITEENYVLFAAPGGARLGVLRSGDRDQPAALRDATRGSGVWLQLTTDDADRLYSRLAAAGAEIVTDPEVTPAGQRRFVVRDPNGVLIYLTETTTATRAGDATSCHHHHDQNHCHPLHRLSGH